MTPIDTAPPGRRVAVVAAALTAVAMIAQFVAGKAVRDAFLLSTYGPSALPNVMIASALLSVLGVLLFARAMATYGPDRVVPMSFLASAALLFGEWGLSALARQIAAVVVYCHMAVFGSVLISGFWSLVNERFDPHTAKRVVDRILAGSTLGGVVGGLAAWRVSGHVTVTAMLGVLGSLHLLCAIGTTHLAAVPRTDAANVVEEAAEVADAPSAIGALRSLPYLRTLAVLVAIGATTEALLDYVFNVAASRTFTGSAQLMSFFALFHMGTGLVAFLLQWTLTRVALQKLGVAITAAILPLAVLSGSLLALSSLRLGTIAIAEALDAVVKASFFRGAYEVLYTPVPADAKRPTKAVIDVGFDRLGVVVGGALAMASLRIAPVTGPTLLVALAVAFGVVALALTPFVHRGYVATLEGALLSGAVRLDESGSPSGSRVSTATTTPSLPQSLARARPRRPIADLTRTIADLASDDVPRIRRVLGSAEPLDARLVGFVVPFLAREELYPDAMRALRRVADRATGQLVDALLDPATDRVARRRVARVLTASPTQRAADGLLLALSDRDFDVRYNVGLALLRVTEKNPKIALPRDVVLEAARREAELSATALASPTIRDLLEDESDLPIVAELREHADRRVEHVFAILSLVLDREPLKIACRALHTGDDTLRGTALEYLENVVPEPVLGAMAPLFGDTRGKTAEKRPLAQLLAELTRLRETITQKLVDLGALPKGPVHAS